MLIFANADAILGGLVLIFPKIDPLLGGLEAGPALAPLVDVGKGGLVDDAKVVKEAVELDKGRLDLVLVVLARLQVVVQLKTVL